MITQYVDKLLREIRDRQDSLKNQLVSNSIENMEQYRLINGKLQGLETALVLAKDLFDAMVENRMLGRESVKE